MQNYLRPARPWLGIAVAAICATGCFGGDDDSSADNNPTPPNHVLAEAGCTGLATKMFTNSATVTTRWATDGQEKAGTTSLPAHCVIDGLIDPRIGVSDVKYGIKFQLRLPADWNGRFFFQGGGGTDGSVSPAYGTINSADGSNNVALAQGYATVSTDGGHDNAELISKSLSTAAFGFDAQARTDWGYTAIDKTTTSAKSIIQTAYGSGPEHSYFVGCSTGGRQGMQFTQLYPDYFDGVVAGDPVMDLGSISAATVWGLQQFAAISTKDPGGKPQWYSSFTPADQQLFTTAYLGKCDALDGIQDGMVQNPSACHFDPAVLQCGGAKDATCLSPAQVGALKAVVGGPVNSSGGKVLVPGYSFARETAIEGYPFDANWMTSAGQSGRLIGTAQSQPGNLLQGAAAIPYLYIDPPNASFDPLAINWDTYPDIMRVNSPWLSTNPNISAFKARGGKVIYYHGTGDPGPTYANTVNYYNRLTQLNGGAEATQKFARLFLVPGMGHCSGGPSADSFDQLTAIVNWVEKGAAPDTLVAKTRTNNAALNAVTPVIPAGRTRPLCPYPTTAKYKGTGSIEDAANFSCSA